MTDTFTGAKMLTPEENLFGRVLIRNGLAEREEVEACAREAVGGTSMSLEEALVKRGVLRGTVVKAVRAAIEKELREHGLTSADFAPPGASGVLDPVKPDELRKTPPRLKGREGRMRALVKRVVRSRLHRQLLEHILADQMAALSVGKLSRRLDVEPGRVMNVLVEWKKDGIVKSRPEARFLFSPTREELGDMRELMRLWTNGRTHSKVLGWILREEFG